MTATEAVSDKRSLHMYNFLRQGNPYLPEPHHVVAFEPLVMTFGPDRVTTLQITMMIDLPEGSVDDDRQEAPSA